MVWFSCATKRAISCNYSTGYNSELGVLMHQQVGNGSLYNYFNNPAAQVSAHFWVGKNGTIEQYVDTNQTAWHAMQLNARYSGIEFEGMPDEALTDKQIQAGGRILKEGNDRHGWPLVKIDADYERGFGYHRMAVSTACPSQLRLNARDAILAAAKGQEPKPEPIPEFPEEDGPMVCVFQHENKNLELWWVQPDGELQHRWWNPTGNKWNGPERMQKDCIGSPVYAMNEYGTQQVYCQKKGGGVISFWWSGGKWGTTLL